ncbi:unnamed protein product [Adineta steineri]|uniref:PDEase domain-containing protein n=1 Tax=Adineta steineri TaxID=433720 RepID=A0A813R5C0_9BILA|nr:unnamed protein product [Adineta steineri]
MSIIKSSKKQDQLLLDGYCYRRAKSSETTWRCSKNNCAGRVRFDNIKYVSITDHNHAPNPEQTIANEFKSKISNSATISHDPPRRIIHEVLLSIDKNDGTAVPTYSSSQRTIERKRKKNDLPLPSPKSLSEIQIPDELKLTNGGQRFLLYDNGDVDHRMVILSSDDDLDCLSNSDHWHCDGTFKMSPQLFYQLYTLHGFVCGRALPLVYCFISGKSEPLYGEMFDNILKHISQRPTTITIDFEKAVENVVKLKLPMTTVSYCFFHFKQSLWRQVQGLGLQDLFVNDHQVRRYLKNFACLTLVPESFVIGEFERLQTEAPDSINEFVDYYEDVYIGRTIRNNRRRAPRFTIPMWNCFARFKLKKIFKWKLTNTDLPEHIAVKIREQIRHSFNDWAKHTSIIFQETGANDNADLNFVVTDQSHKRNDTLDGKLKYTIELVSDNSRFEMIKPWMNEYNLRFITTHQIGHFLGLNHCNDTSSIMFPYYQNIQPKHFLTENVTTKYGKSIPAFESKKVLKAAAEVVPTKTNKTSDKLIKSRKENGRYTNSFNPKFKFPSPALAIKWKMSTGVNTQLPYSKKELDKFLPIIRHNNSEELFRTTSGIRFIWIGHATCYIQMNNFRFLLDPIFSKRCGITSLIGPKCFRPPALSVNDLPGNLDAILISHNHFDHLDFRSVLDLNKRYGARLTWFCGLGLRKWFLKMGIRNVIELDWWQKYHFAKKEINIAFCPAQHWSRRTAFDINQSLWGGYAVWNTQHKFYYAGDTGYTHNISIFQQIGKQYGPFDLSAIPIGAYEPRWMMEAQHVSPDEAVQIHMDVQSKQSIGVHWGTFALANEYFMEPPFKLSQAVKNNLLNSSSFIVLKHVAQIYNVPTTTTFSEETPIPELGVETPQPEQLRVELNRINDWNFNIFRIEAISGERPLTAITYRIFQERDLIRTFSIEPHKLLSYLFALEDSYQQVPYHNKLHGADVCQSMHVLLNSSGIKVREKTKTFCFYYFLSNNKIKGRVQRIRDPGGDIRSSSARCPPSRDLAILYNDESVLENHHLAIAFKLLQADERSIFSNLSAEQMETLRKRVVDMVLATDMAKHKTLLADFQNLVAAKKMSGNDYLSLESYDDRILVLKNMIHCADLSNMTKPLDTYSKWIDRLMVEFWKQGDAERDLGLDISPMCVRSPTTKDKHQIGFINGFVHPLWETWGSLVYPDANTILETLAQNREWHEASLAALTSSTTDNSSSHDDKQN